MSLIVYPVATDRRVFLPSRFMASVQTNQRVHASPFGGSEQVVDLLNDRWMFSMELAPVSRDDNSKIEAFIAAMRGSTNTTELYHFGRPVPRGTLSGVPTAQAASAGASTINLNATTGQTLLAGDLFGVGGLLLQVANDAVSVGGVMAVSIVNRLRVTVANASTVTFTKPTATFRLVGSPRVQHAPGMSDPLFMDFAEVVA